MIFPNTQDQATGSIAWPHQALEPVYEWNDTWSGSGGAALSWPSMTLPALTNHQDMYFQCGPNNSSCSSFTGAAGAGSGSILSDSRQLHSRRRLLGNRQEHALSVCVREQMRSLLHALHLTRIHWFPAQRLRPRRLHLHHP